MDNVIPIQTPTPVSEQPQTVVPTQEPQIAAPPAPVIETSVDTSTPGTLPSMETFIKETSADQGISEDVLRSVIESDPDSFADLYSPEPEKETTPESTIPATPEPETHQPKPMEQDMLKAEILQLRGQIDKLTRSQLEALKQQAPKEPEKAPEPIDPVADMVKAKVAEALKTDPRIQAFERQQASQKQVAQVEAAETAAKASHPDYQEVTAPIIQSIQQAAQAVQAGDVRAKAFIESIFSQPNPAEYIYTIGARAKYEQMKTQAQATLPTPIPALQQTPQSPPLTPEQQATLDKAKQNVAMPVGPSIGGDNGNSSTLTMEQISHMTPEQWIALPEAVRIRALSGQI